MRVKRWLAMLAVGITILSLGFAYLLRELYPLPAIFYYLTLQFIPRTIRGVLFGLVGVLAVGVAIYELNRSLLAAVAPGSLEGVVQTLYRQRSRGRGPRIVAIGGGRGLCILLRGLKEYTSNLTVILTLGSTANGEDPSRRELDHPVPDDFRRCLVALAGAEALVTQLFQYRFPKGESLTGYGFGNLFLAAMEAITGDFERALEESSRVLAIRGQILPSTLERVRLCAAPAGRGAAWEQALSHAQVVMKSVTLQPESPAAYPRAVEAIQLADMIVIGPGSLYTQVLPGLLIKELAEAIRASRALKVFVCDLVTEPGETDGYTLSDHVQALHQHLGDGVVHLVLANRNHPGIALPDGVEPVTIDARLVGDTGVRVIDADILDPDHPTQHHPQKLARAVMSLLPR